MHIEGVSPPSALIQPLMCALVDPTDGALLAAALAKLRDWRDDCTPPGAPLVPGEGAPATERIAALQEGIAKLRDERRSWQAQVTWSKLAEDRLHRELTTLQSAWAVGDVIQSFGYSGSHAAGPALLRYVIVGWSVDDRGYTCAETKKIKKDGRPFANKNAWPISVGHSAQFAHTWTKIGHIDLEPEELLDVRKH